MKQKLQKPRKEPIQKRSIETVEVILEAAAHIFIQRGYASGTTNHIAKKAGVSIGSLYQYFPNKDAILICLIEKHLSETREKISELLLEAHKSDFSVPALIHNIVKAMIALHMQSPELHRVMFDEIPLPEELKIRLYSFEEDLVQMLVVILKESKEVNIGGQDPIIVCRLIVQVVESLTHWYTIKSPMDIKEDDIVEHISCIIERYLGISS